jgi:hypothetical protein
MSVERVDERDAEGDERTVVDHFGLAWATCHGAGDDKRGHDEKRRDHERHIHHIH